MGLRSSGGNGKLPSCTGGITNSRSRCRGFLSRDSRSPRCCAAQYDSDSYADEIPFWTTVGEAATPLHPGGKAMFGDALCNVITQGEMIAAGTPVKVIGHRGSDLLVIEA